jgi:acetoin utilization deacetylase AcuC-like enzyme
MEVALLYHPACLGHHVPGHVEHPARVLRTWHYLDASPLRHRLQFPEVSAATEEDLLLVHSEAHVDYLRRKCALGGGWVSMDTAVSEQSHEAGLHAVGAGLTALDWVGDGPDRAAFCLIRPPGHHASRALSGGFCLYNSVAIAAERFLRTRNGGRVYIFDFDLHHGNGTQEIFYDRAEVCYLSLHQFPAYPRTGRLHDRGEGEGLGFTINVPLPAGRNEPDYLLAAQEVMLPSLAAYGPDLVLVSAGFDAHRDDPFGGMELPTTTFGHMAALVQQAAVAARAPVIYLLEGGYALDALAASVAAVLRAALGDAPAAASTEPPSAEAAEIVARVRELHAPQWESW